MAYKERGHAESNEIDEGLVYIYKYKYCFKHDEIIWAKNKYCF